VLPEHLCHTGKLPTQNRVMRKPKPKRSGTKNNSPHNKWLRVGKQMEEEKVLNSVSSLSYDRSNASSKSNSPHSAIKRFLLQM
jgi:hypothetical protein